jgi:hypothetical protein
VGRVQARQDRLESLGHLQGILDALATVGVIPAGGYESLRREFLSDRSLVPYLPEWLAHTRTSDEAAELISRSRDASAFIRSALEPAFEFLEAQTFKPRSGGSGGMSGVPCPFCTVAMVPVRDRMAGGQMFYNDEQGQARVEAVACPNCQGKFLLHTRFDTFESGERGTLTSVDKQQFILWPRTTSRPPVPAEVPEPYASLATEAALILEDSPRASAALSRRCLQQLVRDEAGGPASDLYHEIELVLDKAHLPAHLQEGLHELRTIGNMAAHPNKSTATGDYLEVEPGEAEWGLDVLYGLFDFYFVQPARAAARKLALQTRLGNAPG